MKGIFRNEMQQCSSVFDIYYLFIQGYFVIENEVYLFARMGFSWFWDSHQLFIDNHWNIFYHRTSRLITATPTKHYPGCSGTPRNGNVFRSIWVWAEFRTTDARCNKVHRLYIFACAEKVVRSKGSSLSIQVQIRKATPRRKLHKSLACLQRHTCIKWAC